MARPINVPPLGVVSYEEVRGLYWASVGLQFPQTDWRVILPRAWVGASGLYQAVASGLDPEALAELARRRAEFDPTPTLGKCVGEAIYERVRASVLPSAPSRLSCLWAALDAYAAVEFAQTYLPAPTFDACGVGNVAAIPVSTADGRWVALDMHLFEIPSAIGLDTSANEAAVREIEHVAERYWSGRQSDEPFVEVLAERLWQWTAFVTAEGAPPPYRDFISRSTGTP